MEKKNFVCIECPRGCALAVTVGDGISVEGNFCPKGKAYAEAEVTCPRRIVTSSVRGEYGMISVKTDRPVKKTKIFESYGLYICGFSYNGDYFMIADDGGIIVLKRCC